MLTDLLSEVQPSSWSALFWSEWSVWLWTGLFWSDLFGSADSLNKPCCSVQLTVLVYRWTDKLQRTQPTPLTVEPSLEHTTIPNKGGDSCCPLSKKAQKNRSNYSKWRLIQSWLFWNKKCGCAALTSHSDCCVECLMKSRLPCSEELGPSCCTAHRGSSAGDTVDRVKSAPPGTNYDPPQVRQPEWLRQALLPFNQRR